MVLYPACLTRIPVTYKVEKDETAAKLNSPGILIAAAGVFLFGFIETLSILRVIAVFTAFLIPLFYEANRKRKNGIEVYKDKKSAAIN